jgi:plastocyanin
MRRATAAGALLAALAMVLALAGCGGRTSAEPAATNQVEMPRSYKFEPAVITVRAGTTVTWHNGDNFTHSVHVAAGVGPDLTLAPGESGSIQFSQPGQYDYVCLFHEQQMKGKVIVTGP